MSYHLTSKKSMSPYIADVQSLSFKVLYSMSTYNAYF